MVAKTISIHHFEKKKVGGEQIIPKPKDSSTVNGHKLYLDDGGYFTLKKQDASHTITREDIPFSVGYNAALARNN